MVDTSVRISEKHKEEIDAVADQLDTSVKAVVGMILTWFFETDWGNPERILEALGDDDDDEELDDEDEEEDDYEE